jgi:DNA/RNA endonuclease YhcR with UshA esterase domain
MKKVLALLLLCFLVTNSFGQTKIELQDIAKHVGDTVQVEGKIFGVKTFPDNAKAPTLLNLGADFPKQTLSVAVFPSFKTDENVMPDERFIGDIAIITGKVELFKGKPQIAVRTPGALRISSSNAITPAQH